MNFDFIDNIAESVDWRAHHSEQNDSTEIAFEFETWTKTAGQNVLVSVVVDATDSKEELLNELVHELNEYYEAFDPEEEAGLYWQNRHNLHGVPSSLRRLLDDMDEAKGLIERLADAFAKAYQDAPCECCVI